ncbi:TPA: glycosyltransferase family 2 protein [Enterobacter cloacae]|nr:glycosyltransferase family 2 protein [Enterobacter pasteurii]
MNELVSIIMPSYNSSNTISSSIQSVLDQKYENWELLITDDCSSDNTLDIILNFSKNDERIKVFSSKNNCGAGAARNNSIDKANGRYIAFLDSDDMWHEDKLVKQVDFMLKGNYALTYTAYSKINMEGQIRKEIKPPIKVNYNELLKSNVIGCLTAMYDAKMLGKVYMPLIRKRQDMALWLSILKKIDFAYCLNESLAFYREGHSSLSSNKFKVLKSQWSFYRDHLGFSYPLALYYFFNYIHRALIKHA